MGGPIIHIARDEEALFRGAADRVVQILVEAREGAAVALPGGRTPIGLYRALLDRLPCARFRWRALHFFFGDERCVPPDHAESNYGLARTHFLEPLGVDPAHVHRLRGEAEDLDAAARAYERELEARCPEGRLDLIVLGMGADGHTASLFPGTEALRERRRLVVPNHVEALGTWRLTLTYPALDRARNVLFLVAGPRKAGAVARAIGPRSGADAVPAARVRPEGALVWLLDEAAASCLRTGGGR